MKMIKNILSVSMVVLALTSSSRAANEIYYVNKSNNSPGNGTSWNTAFNTIAEAILEAEATDQIWVAGGESPAPLVYVEESELAIIDGVRLYGGFPPTGSPGFGDRDSARYVTIISGDVGNNDEPGFVNRDDNLESLVSIDGSATDDTIVDGFTTSGSKIHAIKVGASAEPQFEKLIVIDNGYSSPAVGGAGVTCGTGSSPRFTDCRFEGNRATQGAAIYGGLMTVIRCEFISNESTTQSGGAIVCGGGAGNERLDPEDMENWSTSATPLFRNCRFMGNSAGENGGAIWFGGQLRLMATTFSNNSAGNGGAIAYTYGSLLGLNLQFDNNSAQDGGAIYNNRGCFVTLINTLAHDNEAADKGGVIYMEYASTVFLQNVTFARNLGENAALYVSLGNGCGVIDSETQSDLFVQIKNSIVWDHEYPSIFVDPDQKILEYNDLDYGAFGPGGISTNPLFIDPDYDNFRLSSISPCIDAADTRILPEDLFDVDSDTQTSCTGCDIEDNGEYMPDLDFHLRVTDVAAVADTGEEPTIVHCPRTCEKVVDMGSYEFSCATCEARGDLNGDGLVNGRDIHPFTQCAIHEPDSVSPCLCADFSGPSGFPDGFVNYFDVPCFIELLLTGATTCSGPMMCGAVAPSIQDCNGNDIPDANDIAFGISLDCNKNGIPDECDLSIETSNDVNSNDIPDECETDCDGDTIPDAWAIAEELVADINENGIPDSCEPDCNGNDQPDDYDIAHGADDCNENGVPDVCEEDCNGNDVPDDCDIANETSLDCNANGIPDECDLARSFQPSFDCNDNNVPDECDIANETSVDENENHIPDECEEESRGGGENMMGGGEGGPFDAEAAWEEFYGWYAEQISGDPGDWDTLSGPERFERVMDELQLLGLPIAAPW